MPVWRQLPARAKPRRRRRLPRLARRQRADSIIDGRLRLSQFSSADGRWIHGAASQAGGDCRHAALPVGVARAREVTRADMPPAFPADKSRFRARAAASSPLRQAFIDAIGLGFDELQEPIALLIAACEGGDAAFGWASSTSLHAPERRRCMCLLRGAPRYFRFRR